MSDPYPCTGLGELFFADLRELKYPERSMPHTSAVLCCEGCPHRQPCAQRGIDTHDKHTVRAGQRLWIQAERDVLRDIAEGRHP